MATVTRPSEPLPDPGDEMKAEQIRDWINNLLTFLETTNIDENNVDLTGTDGIVGKSTAQVITGAKTFESTAAAAGGVREVIQFGLDPASGTAADGDGGRFVLYADDDGGTETDIAYIDWVFTDASNGSEDSRIDLRALLAGTMGTVYTAGYSNTGAGTHEMTVRDAAAANVLDAFIFEWEPDTGTALDNQGIALAFKLADDAGAQTIFATLDVVTTDVSDTTETARFDFKLLNAGSEVTPFTISGSALTSGVNIVSDTDSTDDLGTTSVRWANLYVDSIGDTGQALTITAGTNAITLTAGDVTLYDDNNNADTSISIGTSATERIGISVLNGAANKTAEEVRFTSYTASATADHGKFTFYVDESGSAIFSVDDGGVDVTGAQTISSTLDVTGLTTATGGVTSGGNIISDTDSTDDLGTSSVRWANVYTDSIGDTGQDLTVAATTVNLPSGHIFDYNGADVTITHAANTLTIAGGTTVVDALTSGGNVISDTDSTDDLGTTSVRWANLYVDSIGDTGQALALTAGTNAITVTAGDVTIFDDNNNADTSLSMGTSATEALKVEVLNGAANKTAEEVRFTTSTASATADHGKMSFYVDDAQIATIDDGGIDLAAGLAFTVNGAAIGGAALTGSTDNTIVTVTGADAMQGEANLTFDGTDLAVGNAAPSSYIDSVHGLIVGDTGDATSEIVLATSTSGKGELNFTSTADATNQASINYAHNTTAMTYESTGGHFWETNGTEHLRLQAGNININDTANANLTQGISINQGANDDEILAFKSSDVAHGMTSVAETDTYGRLGKQTDAEGGTQLLGVTEGQVALELQGVVTTANSTKTTAGRAPVEARAFYKSGTTKTGQGANENTFVIYDGNGTVFIVDSDGDYFYDGVDGGAFDTYADAELTRAFTHAVSDPAQVVRSRWDDEVRYNEEDLVKAKLIGYVSPEDKAKGVRPLVNGAQLQRLHHGAIWQLHQQLRNQEEEIKALHGELMRLQERNN